MVHQPTADSLSSAPSLAKRLLVVAAVATLAAGGTTGYTMWRSRQPDANAVAAAAAATASQLTTVTALGRLEPKGEVIKVSASGSAEGNRIDRLLVKEGDTVKTGQAIAILDSRDRLSAALDQAQEQVRVAQANLAKVKAGAKNGEIQAQKATIGRLEADRSNEIAAQQAIVARTEVDRRTINISGLFTIGASFAADGILMTSDQNYLRLFPKQNATSVNAGLIQLQPGADPVEVQQVLKAYLPSDVKVFTKQEFIEFEKNYWANNTAIGFIFNLGVAMGFIVGVIIVYQVLSTDISGTIATRKLQAADPADIF